MEALIVVDVQNGFINEHTGPVVQKIRDLVDSGYFRHVIYTKFINKPESNFRKVLNWDRMSDPPETDIAPGLISSDMKVFEKFGYSGLTDEVKQYLSDNKIKNIYLVGVDTEVCVMHTAVDAFDQGYVPFILADYCASHTSPESHRQGLNILELYIGKTQIVTGSQIGDLRGTTKS